MPISESRCPPRRRLASLFAAMSILLGGCATLREALAPEPEPVPEPRAVAPAPRSSTRMLALDNYLAYARLLREAPPAQQKRVSQGAVAAYQQDPTPHRKLRYALTLEVLASPYSDPRKALHLLEELAAATPPLPRDIQLLVDMQVHALRQRLELTDRVAILTKALHDADAKIDALTDIEQNLERPAGGTTP